MVLGNNRINITDVILWVLLAFFAVVVINLLINWVMPSIPVAKIGISIPIIFIASYLVLLFSVIYDRKIDSVEIYALLLVAGVLTGAFFLIKHYIPQLFSILNNAAGGTFSFVGG
jgi:hypothetical protein